jgi:hypothetical protein
MPDNPPGDDAADAEIRQLAEKNIAQLKKLKDWREARSSGAEDSRAFVIEVAGMPKSGKSKAIDTVRHYFTYGTGLKLKVVERRYRIYTPAEGVSQRTPAYLKQNLLDYNCWAGAYALQKLLEANHDNYHDLVILDRGPWDSGCWIEYLRSNRRELFSDDEEAAKIGAFFQMAHWMTQSDLHVVFTVDPATAANREKKGRLIAHHGPASKTELMDAMREIYRRRFEDLRRAKSDECPHVGDNAAVLIDTTSMRPLEVAWKIIESALKILDLKIAYRAEFTKTELHNRLIRSQAVRPRTKQVEKLSDFIPELLREANSLDGRGRGQLRDELASMLPTSSQDGDEFELHAAQLDADQVIGQIRSAIASLRQHAKK